MNLLSNLRPIRRQALFLVSCAAAAAIATGILAHDLTVPLLPAASNNAPQGFVRIINHSDVEGRIRVTPIDDAGQHFSPIGFTLEPRSTLHFNSDDLETGNASKGIVSGTGPGEGDWRLQIDIEDDGVDVEALAFARTQDGFLTSMHDTVPGKTRHRVAIFNPGSNFNQVSLLRLINLGKTTSADVDIRGLDDHGTLSPTVSVKLTPSGSLLLSAQELEFGHELITGAMGDGAGKWQLFLSSSQSIQVMSLLRSPTGHLTNLSTQTSEKEHDVPAAEQ